MARGTPASASATSNSATSKSSTVRAPASPPTASPQITGRPTITALGAQRERLEHVRASANAAVHKNVHAIADRAGDRRQRVGPGRDGVELAAAVV